MFVVILLACISLAASACPGKPPCNNNGDCGADSKCVCHANWTGTDCSVALTVLKPGVWTEGSVGFLQWQYYLLVNPIQGAHVIVETRPKRGGRFSLSDCDIYVKLNSLPTSTDYTKANQDWGTRSNVTIDNAAAGRYYVGIVSNFMTCSFSIRASYSNCSLPCEHGTCSVDRTGNVCQCEAGWTGPKCNQQLDTLTLNTQYGVSPTLKTESSKWRYFTFDIPAVDTPSKFQVVFNITDKPAEAHDCDVYVRHGSAPNFIFWNYKDSTTSTDFSIDALKPESGAWYIGIWGFKTCTFLIRVNTFKDSCVSECSGHGVCNSKCECSAGYTGDSCQNKTASLLPGEKVGGFVSQNAWNWYTYEPTNFQATTIFHLEQETIQGKSGDCDIYVKRGKYPTRFDFDAVDIGLSKKFDLTLRGDSIGSKIYIGVFGWGVCKYTISVNSSTSCSAGCNHGTCTSTGICLCDSGWAGEDCSQSTKHLTNGNRENSQIVGSGMWEYWNFTTTGHDTLVVSLKELGPASDSVGLLYLYVKEGSQPTMLSFTKVDIDINKGFHTLFFDLSGRSGEHIDWVIGVYGNPFITTNVPYSIVAWESPL